MDKEFSIRAHYGSRFTVTRERLKDFLDSTGPRGKAYIGHHLNVSSLNTDDFFAACRYFGLEHCLFEPHPDEITREIESRRRRGATPTTRELPCLMFESMREEADALLDIYERHVSAATATLGSQNTAAG